MLNSKLADGRMVDSLSGEQPTEVESNLNRLFQGEDCSDSFKAPIKKHSSDHARVHRWLAKNQVYSAAQRFQSMLFKMSSSNRIG